MSTPKPRRQSPAVYRRRRLLVLILAVLIIGGIVWLAVAQPWKGLFGGEPAPASTTSTPAATDQTSSTEQPVAEGTPAASASGPVACDPSVLQVVGVADQEQYAADQQPKFSIQLTNAGDVDCTLNVGTSTQKFMVVSGSDTWWQSTDCQTDPSDTEVTLTAGQTVTSAEPVTWDRTRSSADTCDSDSRPAATGGGASYHLSVEIAGVASTETTQFFLE